MRKKDAILKFFANKRAKFKLILNVMKSIKKHPAIFYMGVLMMFLIANTLTAQKVNTIKDRDGNTYRTVKIGNQTWMTEDLRATKFRDGTIIPLITGDTAWSNRTSPAYCWYKNQSGV